MTSAHQATFPGFPFPNTTQIPNDVIDSLMPSLSGGELKVLLYICRRTFGFQKDSDRISLSQISKGIITKTGKVLDSGTGLCKRQVINALKTLEKKNIIIITRTVDETGLNAINTYSLNMTAAGYAAEPTVHHGVVNSSAPGVVHPPSPRVVNCSEPTKHREQKKEEQNKDNDDGVTQALENFGMTPAAIPTFLARYPAAYIREKLIMAQELVAAGSALVTKNPVGWLRRAIEDDYQPPRNMKKPIPATSTPKQEHKSISEEPKRGQDSSITPPVALPQPDKQTERIWQQTIEHLRHNLPADETADRLTGTMLLEVTAAKAVIFVPDHMTGAWLERRLYSQIAKALKGVVGKDLDLQFVSCP